MALKIDTIPSAQRISRNVGEFRQLPAIEWSRTRGGMESSNKYFTSGRDTRWECSKSKGLSTDDIWGDDSDDGFEVQIQDKGGSFLIAYLDLDTSRQFRVFNSLGFEFYQSGGNVKGAIYLHKVGREYKKPGTNEVWSYSDSDFDGDYDNERGTFFHNTDFSRDETSMQEAGFILNRIYFNYGTSTGGSTPTGGGPYTEVQIYNMKLGWGSGAASNSRRICLPKIRPFDQALQLQFG